jgi:membrane protease YdiL (CAAX protease family)
MAIAFLGLLRRAGHLESLEIRQPAHSLNQFTNLLLGLAVLVAIVLQEEVLNRGYVTINLLSLGPIGIILFSTIIFVLIHFLTNRPNLYQTFGWIVSGLILSLSYLISGSLWIPIILHYATDAANVLIFDITGQFSIFKTNPILSEDQRAVFRVGYGLVITALLVAIYGLKFKIS